MAYVFVLSQFCVGTLNVLLLPGRQVAGSVRSHVKATEALMLRVFKIVSQYVV